MKKEGYTRKTTFEKKRKKHRVSSGFARVLGQPAGRPSFAGLLHRPFF